MSLRPSTNELVRSHVSFAHMLARRMVQSLPRHVDMDAVESDALFGLFLAARSFDPARGFTFATYAANRINGEMLDGLRDRQNAGRDQPQPVVKSLESLVRDCDGLTVTLGDQLYKDDEPVGSSLELQDEVDHLLSGVKPGDRRMVEEFYFEGLHQAQIGQRHGISGSRVSQHLKQAREQMRELACASWAEGDAHG